MTDRILPEGEARTYLAEKFDQLIKAVIDGDWDGATAVVKQMRADGFAAAADEVLDGLIEARRIADGDTTT